MVDKERVAYPRKKSDNTDALPSGRIALRVPRSTHRYLLYRARIEGVSLNTYINTAISEKLGRAEKIEVIEQ